MPAPLSLAYLELRLSGGAANANPSASLGGIKSSQRIFSKSVTGISNITGVVVDDAPGLPNGSLTLAYQASTQSLTVSIGAVQGTTVAVGADGRYALPYTSGSVTGYLYVTVTASSLPVLNKTDTLTVSQIKNQLFDDIAKAESWNGDIEYRSLYLHNAHDTDPFFGAKIYIGAQPTGADTLMIGVDPAGVGDGAATGVATTIATESDVPSGVTFSSAINLGASLTVGQLDPGNSAAVWMKRTVPMETSTSTPNDVSTLAVRVAI